MKGHELLHIGTSGWQYKHWQGPFYPPECPQKEFLRYYADHFQTVEINNTFYQFPAEKTLLEWRETVPTDFIFAVKASRYITHMKKLKDAAKPVSNFLNKIKLLESKLGPILFQLPPHWHVNLERLRSFLGKLPSGYRYTFEFRDPSWLNSQVYEALAEHGVAFCIYDFQQRLSPKEITADFIYIRLHGPDGPYQGQYDTGTLAGWAGAFSTWLKQDKEIFCYFDNDQAGYAIQDALKLQAMIEN